MRSPKLKLRLGASLRSLIGRLSKNFLRNPCGISFSTNKVYGLGGYPPPALQMEIKICSPKNTDFFSLFFYGCWVFGLVRYSAPPLYRNFVLEKNLRIWRVPPSPLFRTDSVKRFLTPSLTSWPTTAEPSEEGFDKLGAAAVGPTHQICLQFWYLNICNVWIYDIFVHMSLRVKVRVGRLWYWESTMRILQLQGGRTHICICIFFANKCS